MVRNSFIIILIFVGLSSVGQVGNEWIDFTQSYYKIHIGKDEFYRITRNELIDAGFPTSTVLANKIQLFRRGQEVALNASANEDGTINYLEFYGQKNNGIGDSPLYEADAQPHTFYNLFSDTASYFLTYKLGSGNGKRMEFSSDVSTVGLSPETYHIEDTIQLFSKSYAPGRKFGDESTLSLSTYDNGEGWTGSFLSKNRVKDVNFILKNFESLEVNPILEIVLIGGNSLMHNVAIHVGQNASSLSLIANVEFNGWEKNVFSNPVLNSSIGTNGEFVIRAMAQGVPSTSERVSIAYMRLRYPQSISMEENENKIFTLGNLNTSRAWMQISTSNASETRLFNISDPFNTVHIATTNFPDHLDAVIPEASIGNQLIAVTAPHSIGTIEPVQLPNYLLSGKNYLIITHPDLRKGEDPVKNYADYRESTEGGTHSVQIATIDDLYNLYNYGDPSPLAIANFISHVSNQNLINNVFIIGKGFTPNTDYYRKSQGGVNVPTYGLPGGDLMYVLGLKGVDPNLPGIPIGRLNAFSPSDVTAYLNKVIEMESLPYDNLFRKDFLQLSGGFTSLEISNFAKFITDFKNIAEGDFIGGKAFNTGKKTSSSVQFIDVTDRVNQGVGYVTFFGHSSGTVTDIEIGRVSNPEFGFSNKGRYPFFLVNGCKAGEIFGSNFTFGEDWINTANLGAVGFIAHSDIALPVNLFEWSTLFYKLSFANDALIGESVGNIILEVSKRFLNLYGSSNTNLTQIQQMILQGDPSYRVFGADNPDYQIDDNSVSASAINGGQIVASQSSFKIDLVVKNFGRTIQDSLVVQVNRTFADGTQRAYTEKFNRPLRQDTLSFFIPNDINKINEGLNLFEVLLDPENTQEELNETNNVASLQTFIYSGNTSHLYPIDNATVSEPRIKFVWQSSNLLEKLRNFEIEIDTRADFLGANNRKDIISGKVLASHEFNFSTFSLPDTSTIYWRTRFAEPEPQETNEWVKTSFTLINNISEGWGQYNVEQVEDGFITGVQYNSLVDIDKWAFTQSTTPIDIFTFGKDHATFSYENMKAIIEGLDFFTTSNTIDPRCLQNTFNAIVFEKESGSPYQPIRSSRIDVFNREICGRLPQRIYQFSEANLIGTRRRLQVLVDNMQEGEMIVLFNIGSVNYSNWNTSVSATLNSLGIDNETINSLVDGQPVIFFGRKGGSLGSAIAVVNDGSSTNVTEQSINFQGDVTARFTSGKIKTRKIGPAMSWGSLSFNIEKESNDNITIDLFGVDKNDKLTLIESYVEARDVDISTINPILYPQLEILFSFNDHIDQTPPELNFWNVTYDYPPEGILLPVDITLPPILEGGEINSFFYLYNISGVDFSDSLTVITTLINKNSGSIAESNFKIAPPKSGDTTSFNVSFSSFNFKGSNSLVVEVIPNENEVYSSNNQLLLPDLIKILADETNPILDVTFDGYHILDGDIVSPNPSIVMKMRDENLFTLKSDTLGINISLKLPGRESTFQRINFSNPQLSYVPALENQDFEIMYQPGPLDNGLYTIRVQVQDGAGNNAGKTPYEINFEVINESTITHFYPYPNPFSTACQFVFTLTGNEIPHEIKIQIMTISGRVVREITQDEIGSVKIGNNITTYAWDGTDEFGDELANGVYFYKAFINSNGSSLKQRVTSADKAFKNGFGKLYILR